jgi:predicted membrane protein
MKNPRSSQHLVFGIFILAFGILSLLDNLSFLNMRDYSQFWPLLLGAVGVLKLVQANSRGDYIIGTSLVAVCTVMMLNKFGIIQIRLRDFWPVFIIIAGLLMIFKERNSDCNFGSRSLRRNNMNENLAPQTNTSSMNFGSTNNTENTANPNSNMNTNTNTTASSDSKIDLISFMGGNVATVNSQDFQGGQATAFMGGIELDLRNANIQSQAVLNVFSMFGGISMVLPLDWTVVNNTSAFLGGVDYKQTSGVSDSKKCLIIQGTVMLGGIEIKHKL